MGLDFFELQKLKIISYTDERRDRRSEVEPFEVMFNPDSISVAHANNFSEQEVINTQGQPHYASQAADRLSLNLVVDGTGVADFGITKLLGMGTKSVSDQITSFLQVCFRSDGQIHEPRYLKIQWGTGVLQDFNCRLESVDIEYSLFDRSGAPLHAQLRTNFIGDSDLLRIALQERKSSPDLSHRRIVKSGDTLPLLSKEIYGSSHYYLRVAQVNNLDDFRNLTPGQEIIFPPLDKHPA